MGDSAEKIPQLARDCLAIIWRNSNTEVEGAIKQLGYSHRLPRVREQSIRWTAKMASDKVTNLPFRSFTSYLITTLEDADAAVRDTAKQTIIDLFLTVPPHARADLRREMNMQNVRKFTMQHILSHLEIADGPEINLGHSTSSISEEVQTRTTKRIVTPSSHAEGSIAGSVASTYVGSLPGSEMETMDAAHVVSGRDLEHEMNAMLPFFEGRESERNWLNREKSLNRLRGLLRGNSTRDHHSIFLAGIKALLEGIIKGMTSLRTSLCLIGLQFVKDLCIVLGPGADPFVEQLLGTLVKLTGATKKIQAQAANVTINVLIAHVSYHSRIVQHLFLAIQDKNVAPRMYATAWLRVLLEVHNDAKTQIEHSGLEALDKAIRKGLTDATPGVREGTRATYWKFASIWPEKANSIMVTLDGTAKKQLEKANPNFVSGTANGDVASDSRVAHARNASTSRPPIKTLVQIERARAVQPSIDAIAISKQSAPVPAVEPRPELRSMLSSGPQRNGLGGAVRPATSQTRKFTSMRPEESLRSSVKSISSNTGDSANSTSPARAEPVFSPRRRKPITEQLESDNWRIRVEGVVTLACLLANKEPPNTDGQKITLPSSETLAPILRKLMADSQAEVVDHLMAPEVIAEIAKIIEWESILPRVLLISETDDSEKGHDVKSDCLPAVKAMFDDNTAVQQCLDTLALLKVAGHLGKPVKPNFRFTTAQKRPIIKAVLVWLIELIERHQTAVERGETGNPAFSESSEYKLVMNRTMSMMTNIQPTSMNYAPLATFLKLLRKSDESSFDKNLSTFEKPVIIALRKAWGEKSSEEEEAIDEPVADVTSVLGSLPVIQPVEAQSASNQGEQGEDVPSPAGSPAASDSIPNTPSRKQVAPISSNHSESPIANENEDLTMIPPQSMFAPKTPAGFRQALHMVDSPWSTHGSTNGSPFSSPRRKPSDGKENKGNEQNGVLAMSNGSTTSRSQFQTRKFSGTDVWFRKQMRSSVSASPLPKAVEDKIRLLGLLITRLEDSELDVLGFRKLMKIVREHSTRIDPSNIDSELDNNDIWEAGARFDQMIHALLTFISSVNGTADLKVQAVLLLKLTLTNQPQYFSGHECKAIQTVMGLRSTTDSRSLSAGLDELVPDLITAVDPTISIITILQCLHSYVVEDKPSWKSDNLASLQLAIAALSISVSQLSISELEGFAQALAQLIVKALNDDFDAADVDVAEIRRSTVNLCMAMYTVIGDTRVVLNLLRDLKPSQQNLLTYYFANKSLDT